jgi:hypothetical protein
MGEAQKARCPLNTQEEEYRIKLNLQRCVGLREAAPDRRHFAQGLIHEIRASYSNSITFINSVSRSEKS